MNDLSQPFRDFVVLFDDLQIPYALMGGLAVSAHGLPRPTHDLDFTIALPRQRLGELYKQAVVRGFSVSESYESGWVDSVSGMPLVRVRQWIQGKAIDVDLFLAESRFQGEIIRRRMLAEVDGLDVWVVSPEDLILLKLFAGRPRDFGDIADILFVQGKLDESYLRRWAAELGVTDRLEKALSDWQNPFGQ